MTKEQELLSYIKEHFEYCSSGAFVVKKKQANCSKIGAIAGWSQSSGYSRISIKGKSYQLHRIIWLWHKGCLPKYDIDHINGNKSDNRIENLRDVEHKANIQNNIKPRKQNKSGFAGVSMSIKKNFYSSFINIDGKIKVLGHYSTPIEAHKRYLEAKIQHHKGFVHG